MSGAVLVVPAIAAHDALLDVGIGLLIVLTAATAVLTVRAPSYPVRILRFDLIAVLLIAVLVLLSAREQQVYFLDAALGLGLLSFVATLAFTRAVGTRHGERR